jgi:integral membrane sensor domain MASE1/serine phosphatase RsbU (regulator of sigma subunit)
MPYLARIAAVAAAYYAAAKLGLDLAFTTPSVTAVWAPTGIALAAVILGGYRMWPGVALGAFLANAWTDVPLYTALGITLGNTLEALVGAYLLKRVARFRASLERVGDVVALVALGAFVSTTVSATIGVASLLAGGEIDGGDFGLVWRTWWLGDMGGDLVVAPALLVAATHWPFNRAPGRLPEAAALAVLVAGITAIVFTREVPILYLVYPVMIVVALRLWQPGAAAASLLVAAIAIPLTEHDIGPFSGNSPDDRLLLAQLFVGTVTLTALVLAAAASERHRAEAEAGDLAETLQESLLPFELPEIPGIETAVDYRPASEGQIVGGDFFDVFPGDDGSWAVVVGDVVGKGASAAATTALVRYTLRAAATHERQPSRILEELHGAIRRQASDQACSVVYSRLEPLDGTGTRVTLSSAGHPLPLALRSDGAVEPIGDPAHVLGWPVEATPSDAAVDLAPGDALVLYTDGLTDAYAPRRIVHQDELASALRPCAGLTAPGIVSGFERAVFADFDGRPRDDILVFVLRVPSTGRAA